MLSRRLFLAGSAACAVAPRAAAAEAILTDDGLYRQPWFLESFLELPDDLAGASEAINARFVISVAIAEANKHTTNVIAGAPPSEAICIAGKKSIWLYASAPALPWGEVAAISVSGPIDRIGRSPGRRHGAEVVAAAEALAALLGAT